MKSITMKLAKITYVICLLFFIECDREDFSKINTPRSVSSEINVPYSITKAMERMYENDYTIWFYDNFDYIFPWCQLTAQGLGNSSFDMMKMDQWGGQDIYRSLFPNTRDIRANIDNLPDKEKAIRRAWYAMTFPIQIQPAMTVTDKVGSIIYSEAAMAPYTHPYLITPKYDNQETLFNLWLKELNQAIPGLMAEDQLQLKNQDMIYSGDFTKWAKFCNLLKLKIAVRLLNKDRNRALKIAEEVVSSKAGYMDQLADDFVYKKGIEYHGSGEATQPGAAAKNVVEFLVKNQDPRVRFIYTKNSFNSEVVQAFMDAGKELPPYVKQYINFDSSHHFESWKAPGEPWVRYFGVPLSPDEVLKSQNDPYFKQRELYKIGNKHYYATSGYSTNITYTSSKHVYPTKPKGRIIEENKENAPRFEVVLGSSAETNLYLAEFKLLGANLPQTAQDYFNQGVRLSIERMDKIAQNNWIAYYEKDPVYTDEEMQEKASVKLKPGEIDNLLKQEAFNLSKDGLEKVYIQQYINFAASPNGDIWTLVRRSGIPKKNSAYLPADSFIVGGNELVIPRRFKIETITKDNKNYANQKAAYEEQGFTIGTSDPMILNKERIWFDKSNPKYFTGSK